MATTGTETPLQIVVPQGMESVNGSSVDMGCTSPLVDSSCVMVCGGCSYLTDGVSPDIDTSISDWASQLVTLRRNKGSHNLTFPHVLLTFTFETAVSLTKIEMDLFLCPDWNVGAPSVYVYLDSDYDLVYHSGLQFVGPVVPSQSSCDSLSTITFARGSLLTEPYHAFHILVDLSQNESIEWVHVGKVRCIGIESPVCIPPSTAASLFSLPTLSELIFTCSCVVSNAMGFTCRSFTYFEHTQEFHNIY